MVSQFYRQWLSCVDGVNKGLLDSALTSIYNLVFNVFAAFGAISCGMMMLIAPLVVSRDVWVLSNLSLTVRCDSLNRFEYLRKEDERKGLFVKFQEKLSLDSQ